jgi:hypothetical protein
LIELIVGKSVNQKGLLIRDNYKGWRQLFQDVYVNIQEIQHYKSLHDSKPAAQPQVPVEKAVQTNLSPTLQPDTMDLSAINQQPCTQNILQPPPGTDFKQWCIEHSLCLMKGGDCDANMMLLYYGSYERGR